MASSLATLQTACCTSGICRETDPVNLLILYAQQSANWLLLNRPSLDVTLAGILNRSCTSEIYLLADQVSLLQIIAQAANNFVGNGSLLDDIVGRACSSGVLDVKDPIKLTQLAAQALCGPAGCTSDSIRIQACLSEIGRVQDSITLYNIIAQCLGDAALTSGVCSLTTLQVEACNSHIGRVQDPILLMGIIVQLITEGTFGVAGSITLDDGINPVTVILNPAGAYDFSGDPWVSIAFLDILSGVDITCGNVTLTSVTITNCTSFLNFIASNSSLTSIDLDGITSIVPGGLRLDGGNLITTITATSLVSVAGEIRVEGNLLTALSLPALQTVGGNLSGQNNPSLITVSLPALLPSSSCGPGASFFFASDAALTTITLPAAWPFIDGTLLSLSGCALLAATVNAILISAAAVSPPLVASSIELNLGTNAAPTGAGIAAKAALILAGNSVVTN